MRKNSLIFISLTLCLVIGLSACGKKPASDVDNNAVASSTPSEIKEEPKKEEVKTETPKDEAKKEEVKKEEVKKEAPKEVQKPAATNTTTVSASKPVEQPKQVATPAATTTTQPTEPPQPSVPAQDTTEFQEFYTLMQNAVPCNGKYKIAFDKTQGQAPNIINYTITVSNYKSGPYFNKRRNYIVYNGKVIATDDWTITSTKVANGTAIIENKTGIPAYKNMPKTLDCYVIIVGNDNITYYEKMTYTVTEVKMQ
jgi:hypothetical protein